MRIDKIRMYRFRNQAAFELGDSDTFYLDSEDIPTLVNMLLEVKKDIGNFKFSDSPLETKEKILKD